MIESLWPTMIILYLSSFLFFSCCHHLWCESLIAVLYAAPGSQRSPVNQCGCYSDVIFLGLSRLMNILSLQLMHFFCHRSTSVYSEQMGNINLFTAHAPEYYSQMYKTYQIAFYRGLQHRSWLYYTVWFLSCKRVIHVLLLLLCTQGYSI